ncbi:MAG: hypothetical protein ACREC5_05495, partial [Thermoplasmata archaeon]
MARATAPGASPRGIALLLLLVVGFALLAAVLAHPSSAATPPAEPGGSDLGSGQQIELVVSVVILSLLFGWVGWEIFLRIREGRVGFPVILLLSALAVFLVGIGFVALFHFVGGVLPSGGGGPVGSNGTGGAGSGHPPTNTSSGGNATPSSGPPGSIGPLGVPWV